MSYGDPPGGIYDGFRTAVDRAGSEDERATKPAMLACMLNFALRCIVLVLEMGGPAEILMVAFMPYYAFQWTSSGDESSYHNFPG